MKIVKNLKSFFLDVYNYFKTKAFEDIERAFEEERKKEFQKWKKRYAELYRNKQNQKYNVFVYDTVFYPPDSPFHPKRN